MPICPGWMQARRLVEFCFEPVANELRYSHHREAMLFAEPCQIKGARHAAIAVHDFADHCGVMQPCQSCEVNRRFCLAASFENAIGPGTKGKHMTRAREVFRASSGGDRSQDGFRTIVRRASGCYTPSS